MDNQKNKGPLGYIKKYWKNTTLIILAIIVIFNIMPQFLYFGNLENQELGLISSKNYGAESFDVARSNSFYYDNSGFSPQIDDRKITKNAQLTLETNDFEITKSLIKNYISQIEGFIVNENEYEYSNYNKQISFTIKVKSENINSTLNQLEQYGEIISQSIQARDITESFQDYSNRINRLQTQINTYETMLKKENIEIQEEIQIQNRIIQLENQLYYLNQNLNNLDSKVDYSTISLTLKEIPSVFEEVNFFGLKDGFKLFLNALESGVKTVLSILGFIIPFVVLYGCYKLLRRFNLI